MCRYWNNHANGYCSNAVKCQICIICGQASPEKLKLWEKEGKGRCN